MDYIDWQVKWEERKSRMQNLLQVNAPKILIMNEAWLLIHAYYHSYWKAVICKLGGWLRLKYYYFKYYDSLKKQGELE
jgi:hypothetical protein